MAQAPCLIHAPLAGHVIPLAQVPDPVFSKAVVGPGLAIEPAASGEVAEVTAVAPMSGTVAKLHPHAYVISNAEGRSILVHLGLGTVTLGGQGFTLHVHEGDTVEAGEALITWNPGQVAAQGLSPIVPVVALEAKASTLTLTGLGENLTEGAPLFSWA